MKNLRYRLAAFWALLVWVVSIILVAFITWVTRWIKDPQGTEFFRRMSKIWIRTFFFFVGCRLKVRGTENFKKGKVYVVTCNHNSFIDVPVLTPFVPGANKTIAKIELARIPIFGVVYKRGSILVDRKDKESRKNSFLKMIGVIQSGMHMCIYPEGTRNKTNLPLGSFRDGAFRLAKETGVEIIPAVILNSKKVMPVNRGFWFRPGKIELHFLPAVQHDKFESPDRLRDEVHKIMEDYFVRNSK